LLLQVFSLASTHLPDLGILPLLQAVRYGPSLVEYLLHYTCIDHKPKLVCITRLSSDSSEWMKIHT
jgi:hypothetical protein